MNNSIDGYDAALGYNFAMERIAGNDEDMLELLLLQRDWLLEGALFEMRCAEWLESEHGTFDQLYDLLDDCKRQRAELNGTEFKPAHRKPR